MRAFVSSAAILLGLALALSPRYGRAQSDRDFVFTDPDGHLIIRFAGTGGTGLDSSQEDEILDSEFSTMVHDRLRADLLFEAEPRDTEWASLVEPQIEEQVKHTGPEFTDIYVDCRAASCRIIMEQPGHWSVSAHQAVLETIQKSLEAFIAARRQQLEPVFMITAYDQEFETAHIKAFLRRFKHAARGRPAGE